MIKIMRTVEKFLAGVGIPVYPENGVPKDAVFPYLSYSPVALPWYSDGIMSVRIWDRSYDYIRLAGLVDKLADIVGQGVSLPLPGGGYVCLYQGDPWAQPQPSANPEIKQMYINIGIATIAI